MFGPLFSKKIITWTFTKQPKHVIFPNLVTLDSTTKSQQSFQVQMCACVYICKFTNSIKTAELKVENFRFRASQETLKAGSAKVNGREPKSCLGRVFNFKLGHFVMYAIAWHMQKHALAQSCKLSPGFVLIAKVCPC